MNRIKELRLEKGLSQTELAKILFVNQTAVSQWERGATTPSPNMLRTLADYFHVTTDFLLGHEIKEAPAGTPAEAPAPSREQMIDAIIHLYRDMSPEEKLDFLSRLNTPKEP